jgi:hypothetical protein
MLQFIFLLFTLHLSPPDKWVSYKDSLNRYTIQYPADWQKAYAENAVGFISPKENEVGIFQENVNVMVQDLSAKPMTLKEYTDLTKQQYIDGYGPSSVISMKDTTFCGQQAEVSIFTFPYGGLPVKVEQCWFILHNAAYLLTFTARPEKFESYRHTAEKVIRSFMLL